MARQHMVDPAHPALPGHFPGQPIVPGVVMLERVLAALAAEGLKASGVKRMKFTRPLAPGEEFSVEWELPRKGGLRFSVRAGEEMLASGQLLLG